MLSSRRESSNNAKNMCCTDWQKMRSVYSVEALKAAEQWRQRQRQPLGGMLGRPDAEPYFAWLDPDAVSGAVSLRES